jgi:hypothetical protein
VNHECTRIDAKTKKDKCNRSLIQMDANRRSRTASANLERVICVYQRSSAVLFFSCPFASIRG